MIAKILIFHTLCSNSYYLLHYNILQPSITVSKGKFKMVSITHQDLAAR